MPIFQGFGYYRNPVNIMGKAVEKNKQGIGKYLSLLIIGPLI